MLEMPAKTNRAFVALLEALDAEIQELQAAGQRRFHGEGDPHSARLLTNAATVRQQLRDEVSRLHSKWTRDFPPPPPMLPLPDPVGTLEKPRPVVARAMTHNEVARRLGVTPVKVRTWLESGLLKGQQITRTKWQVDAQDVVTFAREHAELL